MNTRYNLKPSLITGPVRRHIWNFQKRIGVPPDRIEHMKKTANKNNYLRSGIHAHFYNAFSPEHRKFEDKKSYINKMRSLAELNDNLPPEMQTCIEAALCFHDVGYYTSPSSEHEENGYKLLKDGHVLETLKLNIDNRFNERIYSMVRFHGLFSDFGFKRGMDKFQYFGSAMLTSLALISAVDSTAKITKNKGFTNLLFSRVIDRYLKLLYNGPFLSYEDKLRQLFGPMDHIWLQDHDLYKLNNKIESAGLKDMRGFNLLIKQTYFHRWQLLKDLLTPRLIYDAPYFTPIKEMYIPHFVKFLHIISNIIEISGINTDIIVDTNFNYVDFENRPVHIGSLRKDLSANKRLNQVTENIFLYGQQCFMIKPYTNIHKIILSQTAAKA